MVLHDFHFDVTPEKYQQFITVSDDVHPLHTNAEFAQNLGFPAVVVHGNLLSCFVSNIVGMKLQLEDVMIVNQSINFRKPIFLNDHLVATLKIKEKLDFLPGYELTFKFMRDNDLVANGSILIKTSA